MVELMQDVSSTLRNGDKLFGRSASDGVAGSEAASLLLLRLCGPLQGYWMVKLCRCFSTCCDKSLTFGHVWFFGPWLRPVGTRIPWPALKWPHLNSLDFGYIPGAWNDLVLRFLHLFQAMLCQCLTTWFFTVLSPLTFAAAVMLGRKHKLPRFSFSFSAWGVGICTMWQSKGHADQSLHFCRIETAVIQKDIS